MFDYPAAISASGFSIYDEIEVGDPELWVPAPELEQLLDAGLRGTNLKGLPLRTRSKVVKELVCRALGYPIPSSFKKTQPRFLGQLLDIYVQKSNNLQVWNEELSATRRYAIIRVDDSDIIQRVKVVTGEELSLLDATGTLTKKYQARLDCVHKSELVSTDTVLLQPFVSESSIPKEDVRPTDPPVAGNLLPIKEIYLRLRQTLDKTFPDAGHDQERNRGAALHRLVCQQLGYSDYRDDGRFPDVRNQLLEVKLQTSPTIDLGLVRPNSTEPLEVPKLDNVQIRHCDVRYAIFYATTDGVNVRLTNLVVTSGQMFFSRMPQFGGKVLNSKLQIPLPSNFFNR